MIVTWGLGAKEILEDGKKRGTFRTYTFFVDADDVTLKGLTIENHAGPGTQVGQAIALYADGDRLVVDSCRLLGWQDTLFTAPLPPVEIEKDGFIGPKQSAPRRENRQYYKDCYIEGEHMHKYCDVEGCHIEGEHTHGNCGVEGCHIEGGHTHNDCGAEDCHIEGEHTHTYCDIAGCRIEGAHTHDRSWRHHGLEHGGRHH